MRATFAPPRAPLGVRFFSRVDRSGGNGACWPWLGWKGDRGYGRISVNGRLMRATHVSLLLQGMAVPPGMLACHHCDNPPCVNPRHLFLGSMSDNILDAVRKGRHRPYMPTKRTHCKRGHELSYLDKRGRHYCLVCGAERGRRRDHAAERRRRKAARDAAQGAKP